MYPYNEDGHPIANGYKLIGETLHKEVVKLLPDKLKGGIIAKISFWDDKYRPLLVKNDFFYDFVSARVAEENGWTKENLKEATLRDISKLHYGGIIRTVDPSRFGPNAFIK